MFILICGDFNHGLVRPEQMPYVNEFLNNMYSNFLQPCITEPGTVQYSPGQLPPGQSPPGLTDPRTIAPAWTSPT